MGNFIAIHVLRQYNPGTFNRGEDGDAKQVYIGGANRVRFSSQCQKRAIREAMGCEEIRTSRIEEAINACLMNYVNDGTISDEERDLIGNAICSVAVLGSNSWKFLNPSEKNKESGGEADKSRVVTTTNADEIKALRKIVSNKDAIINDAKKKAQALIDDASARTNQMVSEHEIVQAAYAQSDEVMRLATAQAQEILDNATAEANQIKEAAIAYTDELMAEIEKVIAQAMESNEKKYNEQQAALDRYYNTLKENRAELYPERIDATVQMPIGNTDSFSGLPSSTGELNLDMV